MPEGQKDFHHANMSKIRPAGLKCSNCSIVFYNEIVYKLQLKYANSCQKPAKNLKQNGKKIEKQYNQINH